MRAIFLPLDYILTIAIWQTTFQVHEMHDMATARDSGFQFVDIESERAESWCQHDKLMVCAVFELPIKIQC